MPIILFPMRSTTLLTKYLTPTSPTLRFAWLETRLRVRQERFARVQPARRLLDAAGITVFDDSLGWSWARRSR